MSKNDKNRSNEQKEWEMHYDYSKTKTEYKVFATRKKNNGFGDIKLVFNSYSFAKVFPWQWYSKVCLYFFFSFTASGDWNVIVTNLRDH